MNQMKPRDSGVFDFPQKPKACFLSFGGKLKIAQRFI
jgi:hypothetical protein